MRCFICHKESETAACDECRDMIIEQSNLVSAICVKCCKNVTEFAIEFRDLMVEGENKTRYLCRSCTTEILEDI